MLYDLLQENFYSDITESRYTSDNEINVKNMSCCEQNASSDEEGNVSDSNSMQPGIWESQVLSDHILHLLASFALMLI